MLNLFLQFAKIKLSWKILKRMLGITQLREIINWYLYWTGEHIQYFSAAEILAWWKATRCQLQLFSSRFLWNRISRQEKYYILFRQRGEYYSAQLILFRRNAILNPQWGSAKCLQRSNKRRKNELLAGFTVGRGHIVTKPARFHAEFKGIHCRQRQNRLTSGEPGADYSEVPKPCCGFRPINCERV